MTHLRRIHGKHYEQVKGNRLQVLVYRLTGQKVGRVKIKTIYKGTKGGQ